VIHYERNGLIAQALAKPVGSCTNTFFLLYAALMALSCSFFRVRWPDAIASSKLEQIVAITLGLDTD